MGLVALVAATHWTWDRYGYEAFVAEGHSMQPTLNPGDHFLVQRGVPIRPGDVVVAWVDGHTIVKRVLATGGQEIAWQGASFVVDGVPLGRRSPASCGTPSCTRWWETLPRGSAQSPSAPFSYQVQWDGGQTTDAIQRGPIRVPAHHVFLVGDFRSRSDDSTNPEMGPIDQRHLLGRLVRRYWAATP